MFAKLGRACGRNLGYVMHLERTADRELEVPAGAIEWNDNVVRPELRVLDDFAGSSTTPKVRCACSKTSRQYAIGCEAKV